MRLKLPGHNFFILICITLSRIALINGLVYFSGEDVLWKLKNSNGSIGVHARVPGGVYGDLMKGGILDQGDFYYRYNDMNYRHISHDNWTYSASFKVPKSILNESRSTLEFDGLDTIASIKLNGKNLGNSRNMFVKYSFDIGPYLTKTGKQVLKITFESPVGWSKKEYEKQLLEYMVPPKCVDPAYHGECHANHIRKMQASFAWDWGPAFPNMGIWKPWRIVGWSSLKIENILISTVPLQSLQGSRIDSNSTIPWKVNIKIIFSSAVVKRKIEGTLKVRLENDIYVQRNVAIVPKEHFVQLTDSFVVPENTVDLWWPNGYGSQPLYNLTVSWLSKSPEEVSEKMVTVAFRTVELDQNFIDADKQDFGRHFRFRVNNVTMFMKGSNWIPSHVLPEMMTPDYTRQLLVDAAKTHQNCLRVWGGGIYESDEFYQVADELGILIWQDFMFACSMYPSTTEFLNTVGQEVTTQVHRLQHHPSILIWAANNENEAALRGNWYGTGLHFDTYKNDYIKLYVDTVRNLTVEIDSTRPFVVSSPSNGIESEEEGYIAKHPYDNNYGDVHYYNYIDNAWNWTVYPKTRFASEYGFQSWPSFLTLKNVTTSEDWSINSSMMSHRQHHPLGNTELQLQISRHFNVDQILLEEHNKSFEYYLYLTQVHQAVAIQTETEFYRRSMSDVTEEGEGLTSGALYWQLNDIWQGASWSSIEFGGRWKMLHYFAAKFFRPVLLSPWLDSNKIKVSIVNDLLEDMTNLSLIIKTFSYADLKPQNTKIINITSVESQKSTIVAESDLEEDLKFFTEVGNSTENQFSGFLTFDLRSNVDKQDNVINQISYLLLCAPKDAALVKANVQVTNITETSETQFQITLKTDAIALFVWLETDIDGVFTDNGFLLANETQDIGFETRRSTTTQELKDSLHITTLSDTVFPDAERETLAENHTVFSEVERETLAGSDTAFPGVERETLAGSYTGFPDAEQKKMAESDRTFRQVERERLAGNDTVFPGLEQERLTENDIRNVLN